MEMLMIEDQLKKGNNIPTVLVNKTPINRSNQGFVKGEELCINPYLVG